MIRADARTVGVTMLAVIVMVLTIFLMIAYANGDPTAHLGENQPSPAPAQPAPS